MFLVLTEAINIRRGVVETKSEDNWLGHRVTEGASGDQLILILL